MIRAVDLLNGVEMIDLYGSPEIFISGIFYDSRKVTEGGCFIAIEGYKDDGNRYIKDAVMNGAFMIISEKSPEKIYKNVTWVKLKEIRKAYSRIVSNFYKDPLKGKYVIGVTGTNGKTTVVSLINRIVSEVSGTVKIGTLGMECGNQKTDSKLTTPESGDIFSFLSEECKNNFDTLIMEVSSAALSQGRVEGIVFSQAVFTNLSGDHLDFHGSMDEYFSAKLSLFKNLSPESWSVINFDDKKASSIIREINSKYITYGFSDEADVFPVKYRFDLNGIEAEIMSPKGVISVRSSLIGKVNLSNILAAAASSIVKNIPIGIIEKAIEGFDQVEGRLQFAYRKEFSVIVDYAHSDDSLKNLLLSVKDLTGGKLILVFGAGGSRDRSKRPRMGGIAAKYADTVIVTSDNPREEDPMEIISEIIQGFPKKFNKFVVEADRKKAIEKGIKEAKSSDIVVIAGKGHEKYQIFADKTIHFDDFEVVENITGGHCA